MSHPDCQRLLIFDLDETLIYGSDKQLDYPPSFLVGPFHVYERPGLSEMLSTVAEWFDLALWSSATADYVGEIVRNIQPAGIEWRFIWSRDRCGQRMNAETMEMEFVKDLKKVKRLGYSLEQILIVEDTPHKVSRNYGNAIYVSEYEGDVEDDELAKLCNYLETIRDEPNYRRIEKRGWRSRLGP